MKNFVCTIAGILAIISSANAADTAAIKSSCQASDKTLWVERNQVCIPRNPCKDSKFEQYCNSLFKDTQTEFNGYLALIKAYAKTHDLSCEPVQTRDKLMPGTQDYVICMGDDVMVFEFDDIRDFELRNGFVGPKEGKIYSALCKAIDGHGGNNETDGRCYSTTESNCVILDGVLREYHGHAEWVVYNDNHGDEYSFCLITAEILY